uniref:Uncharacterized protein n=1 Tax=Cairina moschata TaxID=8855 RepID=A0A8C3D1A7_CAIMO
MFPLRKPSFSKGMKLRRLGPSNGLFSTSTISAIPDLLILITAPTFATEPLITAVAVMPFRNEAMERHRSPPFENPSSPTPGPFTWMGEKEKPQSINHCLLFL